MASAKNNSTKSTKTWNAISSDDWDKFPTPQPARKESQYDEVLDAITDGDIVAYPVTEEKRKGVTIAIARVASGRNMKLAFRYDPTKQLLAIKYDGDPVKKEKPTGEKRGPGRPRKSE